MNPGQGSSLDMQTSAGMRTNLIVDPKKERLDPGGGPYIMELRITDAQI